MKRLSLLALLLSLLLLPACASPGGEASSASPAPSDQGKAGGILSAFATTDLDGNDADQSIFSDYSVTMVNIWATFCTPCIDEMPDLAALNEEYADRGFQVVGLVSDVLNQDGSISEGQLAVARDIVASTGAGYLHLIPSADLYSLLSQATVVPTTLFVDAEGVQIGYAYTGAREKDKWAGIIEPLLEELGA